jgi:hypothetical protein
VPEQDPHTGRFLAGHKGRPTGSRNKITLAAENMMVDEMDRITRVCIDRALEGDPTCMRIVMDRIVPIRKGRPLPKIERDENEGTVNALLRAVLDGTVTPTEGKEVVDLIESAARVAAVQALGEVRQHQLAAFKKAQERGQLGSGVMLVPLFEGGTDQWEQVATAGQAELKRTIRE